MTCDFLTHWDVLHVLPALSLAEVECQSCRDRCTRGLEIGWLFWSWVVFWDQECCDRGAL